ALRYHDLKEFARSRTYDFVPLDNGYYRSLTRNRSGTFFSLRGNAVVRWEYLPGSTAYVVWTQERADADGTDAFDVSHSFHVVSRAPANNVFLVKVAHHFDL